MEQFLNLSGFVRELRTIPWWQITIELLLDRIGGLLDHSLSPRDARARLLKGIAVVLISLYIIVRLLGQQFGLQRVEFLYREFLYFAAFAVTVVFQPELRRALMRLGETRLFRGWSQQFDEEIDALIESASFCSRRKIGSLVAIERDTPLTGLAEENKGTRLMPISPPRCSIRSSFRIPSCTTWAW